MLKSWKVEPFISILQIYPDAAHSLWTVRPHLYLSMEQFFGTCFLEVAELKIVTLKMTKPGR